MGLSVLMVNLLWALHIPLFLYAPEFLPLSVGIGLGLHWIVYSWIIQHPVGLIHAILRTVLVLLAWFIFPESRLFATKRNPLLLLAVIVLATKNVLLNQHFASSGILYRKANDIWSIIRKAGRFTPLKSSHATCSTFCL